MVRPTKSRKLCFSPKVEYFKPRGVPLRQLAEVVLKSDEIEALKLYELERLNQVAAAAQMGISQPTFARILDRVQHKLAIAVIYGQAIKLEVL